MSSAHSSHFSPACRPAMKKGARGSPARFERMIDKDKEAFGTLNARRVSLSILALARTTGD